MAEQNQERWASRMGVIMAVAGSAVGLGNFLRFPGLAAQYGGGAFMLAYGITFLIVGLPVGWAEWAMGRRAGQLGWHSSPAVLASLVRAPWAKYLGLIGVLIPVIVSMYYIVIEAWCLGYAANFWRGAMHFSDAAQTKAAFTVFTGGAHDGQAIAWSWGSTLPWLIAVFVMNLIIVYRGLRGGIETVCNIGLPMLVVLAMVVLVRVMTLGTPDAAKPEQNINAGLGYLWNPTKLVQVNADGSRVDTVASAAVPAGAHIEEISPWQQLRNPRLWLAAAGQIFFSLGVGFGIIIVYASYLGRDDDIALSGLTASSANEFCEVALGGLITVPAAVAFLGIASIAGQAGIGLGFKVLPLVFAEMPGGAFFGGAFFFMLFLAAITSSIAMLQPGLAFLEEALNIGKKAGIALLALITGLGAALVLYYSQDMKALDTLDFWGGTLLIFILATAQTLIFGWKWGITAGFEELERGAAIRVPRFFRFVLKWVCPVFLITIFGLWIAQELLGVDFAGGARTASGYITDLVGGMKDGQPIPHNGVARLSVGLILAVAALFAVLIKCSPLLRRASQGLAKTDNHTPPP